MDFKTKPLTREQIREIAAVIRKIFKCRKKYFFDVIDALERLPRIFKNVTVEIVSDNDQQLKDAPATTITDFQGNYCIKIKESIYMGAYYKNTGGYRSHIMHEICHVMLFMFVCLPFINSVYNNYELPSYESIEWQAKALAGEVLIPYEATKGMDYLTIMWKCKVSENAAKKRVSL